AAPAARVTRACRTSGTAPATAPPESRPRSPPRRTHPEGAVASRRRRQGRAIALACLPGSRAVAVPGTAAPEPGIVTVGGFDDREHAGGTPGGERALDRRRARGRQQHRGPGSRLRLARPRAMVPSGV